MFVHLSSLMSANHSYSLFTTYALSNTHTGMHMLLIHSLPEVKEDKQIAILQAKDKPKRAFVCECVYAHKYTQQSARHRLCKCELKSVCVCVCIHLAMCKQSQINLTV